MLFDNATANDANNNYCDGDDDGGDDKRSAMPNAMMLTMPIPMDAMPFAMTRVAIINEVSCNANNNTPASRPSEAHRRPRLHHK